MSNTAIPDSPQAIEEFLSNGDNLEQVIRDGKLGEVLAAYSNAATDTDQIDQVMVEMQRMKADLARYDEKAAERFAGALADTKRETRARNGMYDAHAPGAALDDEFPGGAGEFLNAIWHRNTSPAAVAKREKIRNDYSSHNPTEGGFLIPETLRSEMLRVGLESAVVRPRARVIPMDSLRVPFPVLESSSNESSIYGGVVAYWTEESADLTESEAEFRRVVLEAKKLTAYSEVPNELFQDSIVSIAAFLSTAYPEGMSWFEDVGFIEGTGTGEPKGFLNAAAAIEVAKESGQDADTIVWENIVKAYSRMLPSSIGRAVWVVSHDAFPELATMALSVGTGGSAIWLNDGAQGPPMTILGRPVVVSEKVPTLGDAGDVNFVDFSYYLIGDRQVMTADTSPHYKFANDQTAFRVTMRCDGRPWISSAITPKNSGSTVSPFVKIAARA